MQVVASNEGKKAAELSSDIIISTSDLQKTYDTGEVKVNALKGIDFEVQRGEMVAVMGPSGCGKTTLLNCLSGIDEPTGGEVIIDGKYLYKMRDGARTDFRANKMGFIFQFFNLLPVLSVVENVELPLLVGGVKPREARKRASAIIEMVGLADQGAKRPAELSGGQQQRVSIARALVNEPTIVWCDEPTGNLDSETQDEIMDLLCTLNKEKGQTFVLVTHSGEVGARADRIVRMRDGRIEKHVTNGVKDRGEAVRTTDK
ncbi:MAG TPA: ABC transporter ATP-binding protein [Anaerolineae bacterium]|jgi:putative ABC transport system ATP-binding protein|nr:ABC transporter ATP-binding protein [Anaerolineae bacterium]